MMPIEVFVRIKFGSMKSLNNSLSRPIGVLCQSKASAAHLDEAKFPPFMLALARVLGEKSELCCNGNFFLAIQASFFFWHSFGSFG